MVDLWTFALLLEDIAPDFEVIEGRVYIDRDRQGREALLKKIANYDSPDEAQRWINMVPIDDFIHGACGEWSISDPAIAKIADVYRRSWTGLIHARWGEVEGVSVELLHDDDSGDLIVALRQSLAEA